MRRARHFLLLISAFVAVSGTADAQAWSGVISPSRAINWSQAGIPGGLPDSSWAQCTTTSCQVVCPGGTNPCGSGGSVTPTTLQNAINSAPAQSYVLIPAGTFTMNSGVAGKNQVVVRGTGANQTLLQFTGEIGCNGYYSAFCIAGSNSYPGGEQNTATWTAGFSQGATQITVSNSLNITAGSTLVNLDQQNESLDTGNVWNCSTGPCGGGDGGFSRMDNTCTSTNPCSQVQQVLVTACSPSCNGSGSTVLSISPGLYMSNWSSSKSTGAWWATTTAYQMGVENLSADLTNSNGTTTVVMQNCYECWVSGIRSIDAARNHVWVYSSSHSIVQNNYFYESQTNLTESYVIEITAGASDNLVVNNICQQITDSCPSNTGGGAGNVAAYNFSVDNYFGTQNWLVANDFDHAAGQDFWLREGQETSGFQADNIHGTHHLTTLYRNQFIGWALAGCGAAGQTYPCTSNTSGFKIQGGSRYFNLIGNVTGEAGYHNQYKCVAPSCNNQNSSTIYVGYTSGSGENYTEGYCSVPTPTTCAPYTSASDPLTINSTMYWGNYDTVTGAVRWCGSSSDTGWSTTCGSTSEVPSTLEDTTGNPSIYHVPIPTVGDTGAGMSALPPSLFYSSAPSWFGSNPWPVIGPDVTNGNLGMCSGGTYGGMYATSSSQCTGGTLVTAYGGHANANPAMACYLNLMNGPPDGSGAVLNFNATTCYGQQTTSGAPPAAPSGLTATVD